MSRTHVVSSHWFRRTARSALASYLKLQGIANGREVGSESQGVAAIKLGTLGLTVESTLKVKRCASARRGRWEVVAS